MSTTDKPVWDEWRPPFAQHVLGKYERRTVNDDGTADEQRVVVVCEQCKARCRCCKGVCSCGAEFRTVCTTGSTRTHVSRFAVLHLHRDPLRAPAPAPTPGKG